MRRASLLIAIVAAASCAPGDRDSGAAADRATAQEPIIGGTIDPDDPAVVSLSYLSYGTFHHMCTGTLIGPQTVLTAAHCVSGTRMYALFGPTITAPERVVDVVKQVHHPAYDSASLSYDVALFKLAYAVPVAPVEYNTAPLDATWTDQPLRQIGYGLDALGGTSGIKREVTLLIRGVTTEWIQVGQGGQQICYGDSGGPGLITLPGEDSERVAGVASFTIGNCTISGVDARVDAFAQDFITPLLNQWEHPTCDADWACVEGCVPVDIDCQCAPDGACSDQCAAPERDPDCPTDCALNHVCHQGCPLPDPDCVHEGQTCAADQDCLTGVCVTDAQRPLPYCSRTCTEGDVCPDQMECIGDRCIFKQRPVANVGEPCDLDTYCLLSSICAGPSEAERRCALPCGTFACDYGSAECLVGDRGELYCDPSRTVAPVEDAGGPALALLTSPSEGAPVVAKPSGCATSGGLAGTALLVALHAWTRRRKIRP